ncbi:hypothetical protein CIB84_014372 [Bambusicola thoracicus]|uniref:Perilipin n=1 Tax=Bambusicola thoracicus TaxID=9083 RepID=A0A2P4SCN7_BAMTH|nr:hypothetical protein CIB84_014372 [Bambusicola thoracicus]
MSANSAAPAREELQQSVVMRVANLPLVSSACSIVSSAYSSTKGSHPYVRSVCDAAEKGVRTLTAVAVSGAQPILTKLEPQISTANEYACKGLDKLEEKLPILQQPTEKVVAGSRELVSCTVMGVREAVSGAVGMAYGAVRGGVERTRRMLSCSIGTVVGTRLAQLLANGTDTVLEKSEELMEHYLPGMDEGPAGGTEVTPREQRRRRQSCMVRVGSLSAKLKHRALRRSLGELRWAQHSAQQALSSLHRIIELIEQGSLHSARQHLHRMWLEWSLQDDAPMEDSQVEVRTMAMLRGLLRQLRAACAHLPIRGLPRGVQETVGHVRHGVEGLHGSLSRARSFHDLSGMVLEQSRQRVLQAQLSIDELLEYVGQHAALPWIVGPFAPVLVEYPEDCPIEMAKWDGCVCVGRRASAEPNGCAEGSQAQWGQQQDGLGGPVWDL